MTSMADKTNPGNLNETPWSRQNLPVYRLDGILDFYQTQSTTL